MLDTIASDFESTARDLVLQLAAVVAVLQLPTDDETELLQQAVSEAGPTDRIVLTAAQDAAYQVFARRFIAASSVGDLLGDSLRGYVHLRQDGRDAEGGAR